MFYLEEANINRKDEVIDYLNEHIEYNSDINGSGALDKILDGWTIEECFDRIEKLKDPEYAKSIDRCPGNTYFLIREEDNRLVGMINIRYNLNEAMLRFGGHIGYGIRPTERRKGYNKINLYLGLIKAKEDFNLNKVMLDCSADNLGSNKTLQALGGVLERSEIDPSDNTLTNVYWIDVNDSIEKYKDTYEPYINSKMR
jgi:predicted acetyltransferase